MSPHKSNKNPTTRNPNTTRTPITPQPGPDSKKQPSELHEVSLLLQLLYHRNKNQHRNQKWWKWLAMLRRSVRKLLVFESGERKRWKRRMEEEEERGLEKWLREVVVPEGWIAFSTVVADTQFAALGVVLIAVLARVGRIVGLPEPKLEPQLSLDRTAGARPLLTSAFGEAGEIVPRPNGEDIGKVVQRNTDKEEEIVTNAIMRDRWREESRTMDRAVQGDADLASKRQPEVMKGKGRAAEQEGRETHPQVRQKKRRKKGNAIDDLFDDLD